MPHCYVYGCFNNNRSVKKVKKVKFYRFPKNEYLRQKWMDACERDYINLSTATVCSEHFAEDCFFKNLKHTLLNYCPVNTRNIKDDAVPTVNLPEPGLMAEYKKRKADKKEIKTKKRKEKIKRKPEIKVKYELGSDESASINSNSEVTEKFHELREVSSELKQENDEFTNVVKKQNQGLLRFDDKMPRFPEVVMPRFHFVM